MADCFHGTTGKLRNDFKYTHGIHNRTSTHRTVDSRF